MPKEYTQNVLYKLNGETIKLQFSFCPQCRYFKDCYDGGTPHYLSPECTIFNL